MVTSAWITAARLGWAGDERGHDADPPVHAVRARGRPPAGRAEGTAGRFTHMVDMSMFAGMHLGAAPHLFNIELFVT
jgi:hypothetical protein